MNRSRLLGSMAAERYSPSTVTPPKMHQGLPVPMLPLRQPESLEILTQSTDREATRSMAK
jgi:hypothetical protein